MTDQQPPKNDDQNASDDPLFDDLNATLSEGGEDIYESSETFDDLSASDEFLMDDDSGYDFDDETDSDPAYNHSASEIVEEKTTINWFNIILIVGAVIIVGGMSYIFFLRPQVPQMTAPQPQMAKQNISQLQVAFSNELVDTANNTPEGGFMHNPDVLSKSNAQIVAQGENQKKIDTLFQGMPDDAVMASNENLDDLFAAIPKQPEPVQETPSLPQAMDSVTSQPTDEDVTQTVDQTPRLPVSDDMMPSDDSMMDDYMTAVDDAMTAEPKPVAEVIKTGITEDTSSPIDVLEPKTSEQSVDASSVAPAELDSINQRIDALSDRMDTLLTVVEGLAKSPASSVTSMPSNTDQVDSLKKTISRLENKVESLSRTQKTVVKAPSIASSRPKTAAVKKQPTIQWDLRGAMNGKAYIAERGTQNIQTVSVGQMVKGLGTIQSIAMENGRWVIRATQQTITQ